MKDKTLFDTVPEPDDDPFAGEPTHFASLKPLSDPIRAWMTKHFGKVSDR